MARITITVPTSVKQLIEAAAFDNRRSMTQYAGLVLETVMKNGMAAQLFPSAKALASGTAAPPVVAPAAVSVSPSPPPPVAPAPGKPPSPLALFAAGGSGVNDVMVTVPL